MPGYSTAAANQALDALGGVLNSPLNLLGFVNLAPTDPGSTGAAEAASTRQACTWNNGASRAKTNITAMTFTGTSGAQAYFRTDSAVTAGTFGISGALGSSVTAATITVAAGALSIAA